MKVVKCHRCNKMYNSRSTLNRHIKNVHQEIPSVTAYPKCSIWSNHCLEENCDSAFASNKALIEHLTLNHNKQFHTEYLLMDDMKVFQMWKSKIERENRCYYVSKGRFNSLSGETSYYYCNRSKTGYIRKEQRSRNEKSQGSCKLNYSCTSQIKVIQEKIGVVVEWQKVHYGHTRDLKHIRLSKEEKKYIVSKLMKGQTPTSIVESFHKQHKEHERRMHLLTVNDIIRIKRMYHIKSEKQSLNNEKLQNHNEATNFWVECLFSEDQQNEDMTEDNINDVPLGNESIYQDNSICDAFEIKDEKLDQYEDTNSSQIINNCSSQNDQYESKHIVTNNKSNSLNNCGQTDQEQSQTEITVFDTKPFLIRQVQDTLLNLSSVNFEDLADPMLNQIHHHLSSINELLSGKRTDVNAGENNCNSQFGGEVVKKEDCCDDKRIIIDENLDFIRAPEDSIILIVEDDSGNKVID